MTRISVNQTLNLDLEWVQTLVSGAPSVRSTFSAQPGVISIRSLWSLLYQHRAFSRRDFDTLPMAAAQSAPGVQPAFAARLSELVLRNLD
ncbi:MAG TPA: hypothetical protein VJ768_07780 [Anaerolineales bacterium]|nr:hypothetical protein [Anaerolineales bacterium]